MPKAADSFQAISALMPACPLRIMDRFLRLMPRPRAISVTDLPVPLTYSLRISPGCGGLNMSIVLMFGFTVYLMIILVIDVEHLHLVAHEPEGDAPVAVHLHRPVVLQVPFQRVQVPARHVHVLHACGRVQSGQDQPDLA